MPRRAFAQQPQGVRAVVVCNSLAILLLSGACVVGFGAFDVVRALLLAVAIHPICLPHYPLHSTPKCVSHQPHPPALASASPMFLARNALLRRSNAAVAGFVQHAPFPFPSAATTRRWWASSGAWVGFGECICSFTACIHTWMCLCLCVSEKQRPLVLLPAQLNRNGLGALKETNLEAPRDDMGGVGPVGEKGVHIIRAGGKAASSLGGKTLPGFSLPSTALLCVCPCLSPARPRWGPSRPRRPIFY